MTGMLELGRKRDTRRGLDYRGFGILVAWGDEVAFRTTPCAS